MEKSSSLAKTIEQLESDLRVSKHTQMAAEQRMQQAESRLEKELSKCTQLESQGSSLDIQVREMAKLNEILKDEKELLRSQVERKAVETEELARAQSRLLAEVILHILSRWL